MNLTKMYYTKCITLFSDTCNNVHQTRGMKPKYLYLYKTECRAKRKESKHSKLRKSDFFNCFSTVTCQNIHFSIVNSILVYFYSPINNSVHSISQHARNVEGEKNKKRYGCNMQKLTFTSTQMHAAGLPERHLFPSPHNKPISTPNRSIAKK